MYRYKSSWLTRSTVDMHGTLKERRGVGGVEATGVDMHKTCQQTKETRYSRRLPFSDGRSGKSRSD